LRALLVGLLASVLVTQAAAAAMQVQTTATRKANVERVMSLDERLERKLVAVRKYRGTIRFFHAHRRLLATAQHRTAARSALALAERRVRQLTKTIAVLRAKVHARDARRLEGLPPKAAICSVFGSDCRDAVAVARCESRLRTTAQNGQYLGLFQMGSYERQLFGHGPSARDQALAARRYFVRSGRDWSPWSCRWAAS
jgi:hypothetical protein